jgi:lincosamide nucleotidyltransferase A/C/D/E
VLEKDAAELIAFLDENGLEVYVDGGWAIDAVLGEQTRPHDDLDIAVPYRGEHLTGRGVIAGYPVRCIPPEWLVKFHTGYELDDNDWHDVRRLCERFQIPVPDEYLKFRQ